MGPEREKNDLGMNVNRQRSPKEKSAANESITALHGGNGGDRFVGSSDDSDGERGRVDNADEGVINIRVAAMRRQR